MTPPAETLRLALAAHKKGDLAEAQRLYDQLLQADPNHADALHLSGLLCHQRGDAAQALVLISKAVALKPGNAVYHGNLATVQVKLGQYHDALASYARVTELMPQSPEAWFTYAVGLELLNYRPEALASVERALALKPDYAEAWVKRGDVQQAMAAPDAALLSYEKALALNPNHAVCFNNRAHVLRVLKRPEDALASLDRAIALDPTFALAHHNRGTVLQDMKRLDEALAAYETAHTLKPNYPDPISLQADVYLQQARHPEALNALRRVVEIAPLFNSAKGYLLHAMMLACEWDGLAELGADVDRDVQAGKRSAEPFGYQAYSTSEADLRTCAELFASYKYPAWVYDFPARAERTSQKIRIGYLCGEFRNQATSILMTELYERHDKNRFEIFAFDNGWDDGSALRGRINRAFTEIIDISRMSDLEAAAAIHGRHIDILVNLNGYFGKGRQSVFSCRPAPIQVNYLGFPGTLGADYMDYLIGDATVTPEASRAHYVEKIVTLPHSYQANDSKRQIADQQFTRAELGLPEDAFVFCCFNNNYKITPQMFGGWMRILQQVPGSVLWLLEDNATAGRNLKREAAARGVSDQRIIFAGRLPLTQHLARHRAADLFLDTQPYNAHTTASDALWAGLPLLTVVGSTFPGRVAASLLRALELPELVTASQAAYEAKAVWLASHPAELAAIRAKLAQNRLTTALFNTGQFTHHIESAYEAMMSRHRQGLPPDHIVVRPNEV